MSQVLVYAYGLLAPTENAALVAEQMVLAHRYQNRLVEIERNRRAARDVILLAHADVRPLEAEVTRLDAELQVALDAVSKERARTRSRSDTAEQRATIKAIRPQLKEARGWLREMKASIREDAAIAAPLATVDETAHAQAIASRAGCGLYWGTYLIVEQAVDAAKKSPTPPSFKRWMGDGAVAVQLQKGLGTDEVFGADTRLQIAPVPATAWDRRRSPEQRTVVRLRVGSDGRDPVWASWPLIMHRPLPAGQIMWAKVLRRRVEAHDHWELHLTLRIEDPQSVSRPAAVAVDLGWRKGEGLRAGYIVGDGGEEREILVDQGLRSMLRKAEDLRSIRDKNRNALQTWLVGWLKQHASELPPWMLDVKGFAYLWEWRSSARFASLALAWRNQRWPGDDEAFERLETWRKQDKHLWTWETNQREKALRRRREGYRVLAADLADRYGTLVLEDFDLRVMQRHVPVESEEAEIKATRQQQRDTSPSELRTCLVNAFLARGGCVVKVDAAYTTQECHLCGHTEAWDAAAQITHACEGCAAVWDQDANAAHVLLARHHGGASERSGGGGVTQDVGVGDSADLQPRSSKWARAKERRSQKAALDGVVVGV